MKIRLMKGTLLLMMLFLSVTLTEAQGTYPASARAMSMGNAGTTLNDVFAFQNNPGNLARIESWSAGLSYENRFLLKEMQTQSLAVAIPLKVGVISFGGHMYGYNAFRSYKAGVGYSMMLTEKFSAGVQMNYQGISLTENYGSKNTVTAEFGLLADITENWNIGFSVFNLNRAKLSEFEDDRLSTIARLGTSYKFSEKFLLCIDAEKDLEYDLRLKTGVEYNLFDSFYLRGGFATNPMEGSFGVAYEIKGIMINIGSSYHQILGWSPHFSLTYQGKKK